MSRSVASIREAAMHKMILEDLVSKIETAEHPVFVCGAGISCDAAPLAQNLEDGLLAAIVALVRLKKS